jgi:hypothetical protein
MSIQKFLRTDFRIWRVTGRRNQYLDENLAYSQSLCYTRIAVRRIFCLPRIVENYSSIQSNQQSKSKACVALVSVLWLACHLLTSATHTSAQV